MNESEEDMERVTSSLSVGSLADNAARAQASTVWGGPHFACITYLLMRKECSAHERKHVLLCKDFWFELWMSKMKVIYFLS